MTEDTLSELRDLIDEVILSSSKANAINSTIKLEKLVSHINNDLKQQHVNTLNKIVAYAKEASGRVKDKDHWISQVNQSWYVFSNEVIY